MKSFFYAEILHQEISKIIPIDSISIGSINDRSTWQINYSSQPIVTTHAQIDQINHIINNIQFITPEDEAINKKNRWLLSFYDYKTIKKFEETLIAMRNARIINGKLNKPVITPASSLADRCIVDDEYMALLDARKLLRDAVKVEYYIPPKN